jgi:hypothetical protein
MANWGEVFANAFSGSYENAQKNKLAKQAYQQWQTEMALKQSAEDRRAKEGTIRTDILSKKQQMIESILGGAGFGGTGGAGGVGGGMGGGNFPAGTTFSLGGLTLPMNRKYTEGEAKGSLKTMFQNKEVGGFAQALGGLPKATSSLPVIGPFATNIAGGVSMGLANLLGKGTEKAQTYLDLNRNIANRLLYLRSGAQISPQEYDRFMAQLPALFRGDKLDVKQLDRFIKEFEGVQGRIQQGSKWDAKSKSFTEGAKPKTVSLDTLFQDLETSKEEE